jgi:hypothetical protein
MTLAMSSDGSGFAQARSINLSPCASGASARHGFFPTFQTSGFFEREIMSKHTQESWSVGLNSTNKAYTVRDSDGKTVAFCTTQERANLIAAAPDLLDALKDLLFGSRIGEYNRDDDGLNSFFRDYADRQKAALAAVKKAEGAKSPAEIAAEKARVIDAAPDMLDALKRIKATGVFVGVIEQEIMDDVIDKAEGRS